VRYEVDAPAALAVLDCNCSICRMGGFLHLIVPASRVRLLSGAEDLVEYTFNTGTARHLFCRHCGIKLTKMAVSPDLRGSGVGRQLMVAALEAFRALDGRELFLESSSQLTPALRLYESVGFRHHPAPRPGSHYARADVYMVWEPA